RIWPEPFTAGLCGRDCPVAGVRALAAECFVEPAYRIVSVSDIEHVIGRPAIVETVGPDTGYASLGHLLDLVVGKGLPFIYDNRVQPGIVGPRSSRGIQEGH